jgi:ABC-type sugar transport system substrate-binding protein
MKKFISFAAGVALVAAMAGCAGDTPGGGGDDEMIVGFAQVGAESGWRTANTVSVQESFAEAGIELKFSDGQGKQENQIKAIRSFIQQQVDIIILSPVVDTGWDAVLTEAKDAGIPVILSGRGVDSDESLWATFLGADFVIEGEKAGNWAVEEFADAESVKVAELFGTTGSTPANYRAEGFRNIVDGDPKFEIIASQTGDFSRAGGKQVMEAFLQSNPDIDLVYAHNDDMGLGAVEAIEAAGLEPGVDIKLVTVDAVKDGMIALSEGKLNFIVECSPLHGPQLVDIATTLFEGGTVERRIITEETTFNQEQAIEALPGRTY